LNGSGFAFTIYAPLHDCEAVHYRGHCRFLVRDEFSPRKAPARRATIRHYVKKHGEIN
jgi:hypothetical protein